MHQGFHCKNKVECIRKYNLNNDEHPCQLVAKFMGDDDEKLGILGSAIMDWLQARQKTLPKVTCFHGNILLPTWLAE